MLYIAQSDWARPAPTAVASERTRAMRRPRAFALVAAIRAMAQALIEPTVISWEGRGQSHFQLAFSYEVGRSLRSAH